ncbi:hypothetical protein BCIN_04g04240 [Botrytis cinerea B05.10]|uniref:Peroxin/Ferlin domain-containing protein n=2 Tax=Botryotinia fuckeliana TaxID=40559 RepID=A0A384JG26_BOTFB|nr:hypothetical protein BCIN_04g04240 [Botrytis cinerea B05.10]ATZ49254.1 hypothetical protein BCIN_04g04240 [Botrytis cinerea B05.10]CCD49814.1 hypothetical protein BofuT4_P095220.1 [Botrytis cinerea T4]
MSILQSKNKRPEPLTDADYDHEIGLEDHADPNAIQSRSRSRSRSRRGQVQIDDLPAIVVTDASSRDRADEPLRRKRSLRAELTRRKWRKYKDAHVAADEIEDSPVKVNSLVTIPPEVYAAVDDEEENRGRSRRRTKAQQERDKLPYEIDILYENERGLILCGLHMFSGQALGVLDAAPWTKITNKPSLTDTSNAQVPDPSWEWAWPEWIVNHDDGVDDEGWEYSFAFSKKWSWHNAKWYSSFVRRRVWIRKRVKKGQMPLHDHMLNEDYFTIYPPRSRSRATTLTGPHALDADGRSRNSLAASSRNYETEWKVEEISNIATLMKVLRICRIDREKMEAVESFIKHGGEELHYLTEPEHMREIMNMFIFQASRRILLARLMKEFEESGGEVAEGNKEEEDEIEGDNASMKQRQRAKNLEAALKAADEEVKRLEYWSDVRRMAEKGETIGAVDDEKGWDGNWEGLDGSGPKDAKFDGKVMEGKEGDSIDGKENENSDKRDKGKERAQD